MSLVTSENLDRAIASKATLSLTSADHAMIVGGKFLTVSADPEGIWIQPAAPIPSNLDSLAAENTMVTGAFIQDRVRFLFSTILLRREKHFWLTESLCVDAVLISMPEEVSSPDFRSNRRHRISDAAGGIYAKLFRADANGKPMEIPGTLWDLSAGGASFVCPLDKALIDPSSRTLVVQLHFRGRKILVPVRQAHSKQFSTKTVRLGLRFDFSHPTSATAQQAILQACAELDARTK